MPIVKQSSRFSPAHAFSAVLIISPFFLGCTSPEREKTTVSIGVFRDIEIRVEKDTASGDQSQYAYLARGDSTIFLYHRYTDYGQEGMGYRFGFTIPFNLDSARYSDGGNGILIIGFGTGMALNKADTLATYDFEIAAKPDHIRISGRVDAIDISGNYVPK